ncbi:MAG: hypothetical protein JWO41_296 [Candidatus Saccharibacteria bacterium]|nr:hypothetical protein [Candidatus Saccharibacteria bacterium]
MLLLTIRTDKPEAEIGLYNDNTQITYVAWEAHRALAETLHQKIADTLVSAGSELKGIQGIVAYQGPGSFTGLRIGLTVANALADSLAVPIVAQQGEQWIRDGVTRIIAGETDNLALPEYGAPVHITAPKK